MPDCDIGTHIQENKQQQANLQKKIRYLDTYLHHWVYLPGMSKKLHAYKALWYLWIYTVMGTYKCIDYGTLSQQNPRILLNSIIFLYVLVKIQLILIIVILYIYIFFMFHRKCKNKIAIKVTKLIHVICMHVHLFEFKENFIKTMSMCPSTVP